MYSSVNCLNPWTRTRCITVTTSIVPHVSWVNLTRSTTGCVYIPYPKQGGGVKSLDCIVHIVHLNICIFRFLVELKMNQMFSSLFSPYWEGRISLPKKLQSKLMKGLDKRLAPASYSILSRRILLFYFYFVSLKKCIHIWRMLSLYFENDKASFQEQKFSLQVIFSNL